MEEVLHVKVRVTSASKRQASGPGQFIMLKSSDDRFSFTVNADNLAEPLLLKEGEELELIFFKKQTDKGKL